MTRRRRNWTEEDILNEIKNVQKKLNVTYMPSKSDMNKITGNSGLSCAVSRHGGCKYFKNLLGFTDKESCSRIGEENELYVIDILKQLGYEAKKTPPRHPYDILVNNAVRIDVKSANPTFSKVMKMKEFVFSINNEYPKCDLFIFITQLQNEKEIYVVPSRYIMQSQLGIGETSKYDYYKNRFDYIEKFVNLFEEALNEENN